MGGALFRVSPSYRRPVLNPQERASVWGWSYRARPVMPRRFTLAAARRQVFSTGFMVASGMNTRRFVRQRHMSGECGSDGGVQRRMDGVVVASSGRCCPAESAGRNK